MSRVALWSMYNNNTSPPTSASPPVAEPQSEALNLTEIPANIPIKRERVHMHNEFEDQDFVPPPIKRGLLTSDNHESSISVTENNERLNSVNNDNSIVNSSHLNKSDKRPIQNGSVSPVPITNGMQFKISSRGKVVENILI